MNLKIETGRYQDRLAAIKQIRTKVFQEEQGVSAELEFDGLDDDATHLLAYLNNQPVGTARIREIDADTVKIERLAVLPTARKQGVGKRLMERALAIVAQSNKTTIIVHAQEYIARLYQQLGFRQVGARFDEAGIAHVKMIKQLSSNN
ncbi:GNAT family N-acetyltransferase [Pleurocapsales cyanobacterium LEGE 10410]|nr:GNAT family N-acetyltransferase [Pleurocapsales cyanobacterium LEGE 10410]